MNQRQTYRTDDISVSNFMKSVIGFAGAATVFSIRQVQNSLSSFVNPGRSLNQFQDDLDAVSEAMSSNLDRSGQDTVNEVNKVGSRMVDATKEAFSGGSSRGSSRSSWDPSRLASGLTGSGSHERFSGRKH